MTVTVIGEAGLGKTRLVQEFAAPARPRDARSHRPVPSRTAKASRSGRCGKWSARRAAATIRRTRSRTSWPARRTPRTSPSGFSRALGLRQPGQDGRRGDLLGRPPAARGARAVPAGAGRLRGPALGRTDLPRPGGIARRPARAIADRRGLHCPPGTARPASGLGGREPTGRFPSSSRRSARIRPQRCLTRCQRVIALPRPPGHGSSRPPAAIPSTWSNWRSPSASRAEAMIRPALPPTLQALLSARLQRLGPGASSVLVRAAIVGKDFGERATRELLPVEARAPFSRNLQTLVAKGLVQPGPGRSSHRGVQLPAHPHPGGGLPLDPQVPSSRVAPPLRRLARGQRARTPFPARSEILGYHLEQSVRYRTELRPADPESAALSHRAAGHLETAGVAAHDRGDDARGSEPAGPRGRAASGRRPALARLYTSLGTALTEAGQLEKAEAALDHAQRIAAANGDERQHAHARVQALLSAPQAEPERGGY